MDLIVNGNVMSVPEGLTIEGLLDSLGVRRQYTAVAVNREIAPKHAYADTLLREGDRVEIVRPMGGG